MNNYSGVFCDIKYTDEPTETHSVYISFGRYSMDTGDYEDANGTLGGLVFYYTDPYEWEQLMTGEQLEDLDFVVIPETIEYSEIETVQQ